ncbi:hypothetical protein MED222_06025 [Vibrio sp. MED222]|nr:hypothetical protein MED222_06025 [Vibrio sp. MED222]
MRLAERTVYPFLEVSGPLIRRFV